MPCGIVAPCHVPLAIADLFSVCSPPSRRFNSIPKLIDIDHQATIVYTSESVFEILGYEPHEVVGKTSHLIFHPDELPALKEVH
jgi:PAS domain-containing protein